MLVARVWLLMLVYTVFHHISRSALIRAWLYVTYVFIYHGYGKMILWSGFYALHLWPRSNNCDQSASYDYINCQLQFWIIIPPHKHRDSRAQQKFVWLCSCVIMCSAPCHTGSSILSSGAYTYSLGNHGTRGGTKGVCRIWLWLCFVMKLCAKHLTEVAALITNNKITFCLRVVRKCSLDKPDSCGCSSSPSFYYLYPTWDII